jgi:aryl-alcohol dehydrogenase-like predicted oxidoreductase
MHPAITCTIPGARRVDQVQDNVAAADLPALNPETLAGIAAIYDRHARPLVHTRW